MRHRSVKGVGERYFVGPLLQKKQCVDWEAAFNCQAQSLASTIVDIRIWNEDLEEGGIIGFVGDCSGESVIYFIASCSRFQELVACREPISCWPQRHGGSKSWFEILGLLQVIESVSIQNKSRLKPRDGFLTFLVGRLVVCALEVEKTQKTYRRLFGQ